MIELIRNFNTRERRERTIHSLPLKYQEVWASLRYYMPSVFCLEDRDRDVFRINDDTSWYAGDLNADIDPSLFVIQVDYLYAGTYLPYSSYDAKTLALHRRN